MSVNQAPGGCEEDGAAASIDALRASEERLALAVEAAQIGVWDWDLIANAFVYSAIAKTICGLPPDREVTYEDVVRVTHPDDFPVTLAQFERAIDPVIRDASRYEYRILRPDGDVRWVLAHGRAMFENRDGKVLAVRYIGSLQDITERRRLEDEKRASAERLRFAMRAGRLGSFEIDVRSGRMTWDEAELEIFGLSPEQCPKSLDEAMRYIHPDDRPRLETLAAETMPGGSFSTGFRVIRPNGDTRWCVGATSTWVDPSGGPTHVFGYTVDITDQRKTEAELAEREALLSSMLDAAALFIFVAEIVGDRVDFLLVNKATADFCGVPAGAGRTDARETSLSADQVDLLRASLLSVWAAGAPRTLEYAFPAREITHWYLGTCTPLPAGPSGAPRLSLVAVDVTDRRMADERQKLLMREVDHRARNALAVVQAVVQLTREDDPGAFKRAVTGRVAAVARAHSLLAADRWSGVDLERLLSDELAPYRTDRPTRIVMHGPAYSLAPATAQSIALILHELATNAAKYGALRSPDGGLEVVWTAGAAGGLEFSWTEVSGAPTHHPAPAPARRGFGFNLLEQTVSRQLRGSWSTEWTRSGLLFTMSLPGGDGSDDTAPRESDIA